MKLSLRQVYSETLIGVLAGQTPMPPSARGNCITMGDYFIRNMSAENFHYWRALYPRVFELEVEEVMDNVVEIVDERVPEHLLRDQGCPTCEAGAMLRKKR